jgi:Zn-finger nucleic acid-binding protein
VQERSKNKLWPKGKNYIEESQKGRNNDKEWENGKQTKKKKKKMEAMQQTFNNNAGKK